MSEPHAATEKLTHLLIVESETQARESLARLMRELSCHAHWAKDPTDARRLLASEPIELVIIDIVSGPSHQESGFEFALWLREQSPYSYVDLLFISKDYPARLYRETSLLRYQALEYLDKPVAEETWRTLLPQFHRGELLPPTMAAELNSAFSQGAFSMPSDGYPLSDEEAVPDPDEWVNALFAAKQESISGARKPGAEGHAEIALRQGATPPEAPHSAQDLPSIQGLHHGRRPRTEGRAIAAQLQRASQAEPAGERPEPSPHTPAPAPHPAPQYLALHPDQKEPQGEKPPLEMPHTTPLRPIPRGDSETAQRDHGTFESLASLQALHPSPPPHSTASVGSFDGLSSYDPEREKPTQSLPGLRAAGFGGDDDEPTEQGFSVKAIKRQAEDAFNEGTQALRQQRMEQAMHAFYRAADLDPTPRHRAYFGWTLALTQSHDPGQIQRAEAMMKRAVHDDPGLEQAHYLLGRFYQHQRRLQEAIDTYQRALSINPKFQEIYREYRLLQLQMTR